ncbi:MAG TPA: response regulator, partial [Pirellulales bacterium]|nr:response regulator [Pirellulales bacterium]
KPPTARSRGEIQALMDINQKLRAAFQDEHVEHLEAIRACLTRWSAEGEARDVDEAFRRAHSLKGAARVTGFVPVETLAHQLESLFALLRSKTLRADRSVLHTVSAALDAIEDAAACLLDDAPPPDTKESLEELERLLANPPNAVAGADFEEASGTRPVKTTSEPSSAPAASAPESSATGAAGSRDANHAGVKHTVDTVRLSVENLDRLLQSTGQLLTENMQQDALARQLAAISQQLATIEREWEALKRTTPGLLRRLAATSELSGLAKYVELVEHETNSLSRSMRGARVLQQRSSWSVRLLTTQLQDDVRHARMVPVGSEFQVFRKMMRELARDQSKEVQFQVVGFDVLADRMVLQALKDPLMHVLRNAMSHGIEPIAERERRGKPAAGSIALTIQVMGNRLTIEVEDDGCGVNLARIAEIAVERGIVSEIEAASQAPTDLTRFLFHPGFTTSSAVTELSGRGMGLSAVYEAVMHLQGQVELLPRSAGGTTLLISVPLSISTHRLLLVSCLGQVIAIPFFGIEALDQVNLRAVESVEGIPMVSLSGELVPLASLANLLDGTQADIAASSEMLPIVVMRCGARRVAISVDEFVAERNALIKNLGPPAGIQGVFMGGILLEDGSVSPVVHPADLVERFKPLKRAAGGAPSRSADENRTATILVVDDSFTTRTLETGILETSRYQVRVAVDGIDALEQLRSEKIDLVISDIQMPRLDGLGLLEEIKRDPRLARIPVIIVSSLDSSEDQERGLSLGADAYIVKRRFDHQELLKVVQQIL